MNLNVGTIVPLAACVIYVVLIALVARQSLDRRVNQLFIWCAFLLMMWSFGSFMIHAQPPNIDPLLWNKFLAVCLMVVPVAFFHFVRAFLGKSQPRVWLSLGYGLSALFVLLTIMGYTVKNAYYVDGRMYHELGIASVAILPVALGFAVAAISNLVQAYREEKEPFARIRIAYPLAGICIAAVLLLSNIVPDWRWYPIDHSGNLINASLLSYAILRYRLLDIHIAVRRGLR